LYQLFINLFSHQIKDAIATALTKAITTNIDVGLNKAISTLPISENIGNDAVINFELVGNPIFSSSFMEFPELGEFYDKANPQECPANICPRTPTPDIITGDEAQIIISDYVANSAGFAFFALGQLKLLIQNKDIPSWSPFRLNTSSFEYLLPALYDEFPDDLMQILVESTQPPTISFTPQGISVNANGNLQAMVILPNNTIVPVFTLTGYIQTAGDASIVGELIAGKLTYLRGNFTLQSSQIGPFSVSLFDSVLNLLFSSGVVPAVNAVLAKGFVIPTIKGLTFENPTLGFGSHYIYVGTNIQYIPPSEDQDFRINRIEVN